MKKIAMFVLLCMVGAMLTFAQSADDVKVEPQTPAVETAHNLVFHSHDFDDSDSVMYITVSSNERDCMWCRGSGKCSLCRGSGRCKYCDGRGYTGSGSSRVRCSWCSHGDCNRCNGSGKCNSCRGTGKD